MISMLDQIILDRLKGDSGFMTLYTKGMSSLLGSGIFQALLEFGKVKYIPPDTPNYSNALASQAEYSRGYNQAIEDILYFRERYLDPVASKIPVLDFGSIDRALEKGDLTEEEANELRRKQSV